MKATNQSIGPPLPSLLYRGDRDSDPRVPRMVRQFWHTGYLRTNLVDGNAIWSQELHDLVRQHVEPGWLTTHFLSFSEDRARAEAFAKGRNSDEKLLQALPDDAAHWDTSIFTLETARLLPGHTRQIHVGIWLTAFEVRPLQHSTGFFARLASVLSYQKSHRKPVRAVLVDVVSALKARPVDTDQQRRALANAERDREWLVLPADPFRDDPSQLTCVLDGSCLSAREKFVIVPKQPITGA